jgi:hypothetical protein
VQEGFQLGVNRTDDAIGRAGGCGAAAMETVGKRDDAAALHVLTQLHKGNPRGQDALHRLEAGLGCCPTHLQVRFCRDRFSLPAT